MNKPNRRLLEQYKLLKLVIHAPWATQLDARVMSVVVEEWRNYKGLTSISARQLVQATGHKRLTDVVASVHRLTQHDVLRVMRLGSGTRATEYALNFDLVALGEIIQR